MSKAIKEKVPKFIVHPLTPSRWADVEDLFGPEKGANSGCWCMWPRLTASDFQAMSKERRKGAFKSCVQKGPVPGLLLYEKGLAIGWVAVSPRTDVIRFEKAKASALEPGEKASKHYAITCFYVRPGQSIGYRGVFLLLVLPGLLALSRAPARALRVLAFGTGIVIVLLMWGEGFVGIVSVFRELGFKEVARRSPRRPLMRLSFKNK